VDVGEAGGERAVRHGPQLIGKKPEVSAELIEDGLIVSVLIGFDQQAVHRLGRNLDPGVAEQPAGGAARSGHFGNRRLARMRAAGRGRTAEIAAVPVPRPIDRGEDAIDDHAVGDARRIEQERDIASDEGSQLHGLAVESRVSDRRRLAGLGK
jgi:hypothetical protein